MSTSIPTKKSTTLPRKKAHDGLARFITHTFGSLAFLFTYLAFVLVWLAWNYGWIPGVKPFDTAPFDELQLILAFFAILLSVMVLISQRRQARLEKISEEVEFEINLRAEKEVTKVLHMLNRIQQKLGIDEHDPELKSMLEELDTEKIHNQQKKEIDES